MPIRLRADISSLDVFCEQLDSLGEIVYVYNDTIQVIWMHQVMS